MAHDIPILVNDRRQQYTAVAGQTLFPYDFPVFNTADVLVYRTRGIVTTTLVYNVDYTLTGIGTASGGDVVLNVGSIATDVITIVGNMAIQRTSDYQESGDFRAQTINMDLDRVIIMLQELNSKLANTVHQPPQSPPMNLVIPPPIPLKYWRWSATNEIEFVDVPGGGGGGGPALPLSRGEGGTGSGTGYQVNVVTATPYVISSADDKRLLVFDRAGGIAVTLPPTDVLPVNFSFDFVVVGGTVLFTPSGLNQIYPAQLSLSAVTGSRGNFNNGGGVAAAGTWFGSRSTNASVFTATNDFRLTPVSGSPVYYPDISNVATLYWTPHQGNAIALYAGGAWSIYNSPELNISVAALAANKVFDIWCYVSGAGVPALEISAAWTSDTVRAQQIMKQDGVWVKQADPTRRLLGTIYTKAAGVFDDNAERRHLWNMDNRKARQLLRKDPAGSWQYGAATMIWRMANNSAANAFDMVLGVPEEVVEANVNTTAWNSGNPCQFGVAIGLDVANAPAPGGIHPYRQITFANEFKAASAQWSGIPGLGRHRLLWIEASGNTAGGCFFYGTNQPGIAEGGMGGRIYA